MTNRKRIERLRFRLEMSRSRTTMRDDLDDAAALLALLDEWEKALDTLRARMQRSHSFTSKEIAESALALLDAEGTKL